MGKFDALWFFVILLAAAPHFSRATYCCYVMDSWARQFQSSIIDCLAHDSPDKIVHVAADCPFGKPESPDYSVKTIVADVLDKGRVEITFEGGDYQFINHNDSRILFEDIYFRRSSGVVKIILGHAAHVNSTVAMVGCYVDTNVVVKLQHDVHFTATNTTFNQGSIESVLSLVGDANQVVQLFQCQISAGVCHTIITGPLCGTLAIEDSAFTIDTSSRCDNAFVDLTKCAEYPEVAAEFTMEGVKFIESIADTTTKPWITVELFGASSPVVTLINNDYSRINVKRGMMYEFWQSIYRYIDLPTADTERRSQVSSHSNVSSSSDNTDLATVSCVGMFLGAYYMFPDLYKQLYRQTYTFLPMNQTSSGPRYGLCHYCCGINSGISIIMGRDIAECIFMANHLLMRGAKRVVHVLRECPFGKPEPAVSSLKISTADPNSEMKVITLEEGDNPFVTSNYGTTFEYIHFKKATGAGVAKMLLGREVATGVNAPVEIIMSGCLVDADVVVILQHDVHFTATNTAFNQGSTESVLSLVGDANQVVQLSNCVLADTVCRTMITGSMCGNLTIKDTELRKISDTPCTEAAVDLKFCNTDEVPNLKIEGVKFKGEVANVKDAAWIKVEGSHDKGPKVTLLNNDYRGLNASTQNGRVYRFNDSSVHGPRRRHSAFEVSIQVTKRGLETNWDDTPLATVWCERQHISHLILPNPRGISSKRSEDLACEDNCCFVSIRQSKPFVRNIYRKSISECVELYERHGVSGQQVVQVTGSQCPLSPLNSELPIVEVYDVQIVNGREHSADRAAVTVGLDNEYTFNPTSSLVFKNIHFVVEQNGTAAGVAKFLVGDSLPNQLESGVKLPQVAMENCVLDADVVVAVLHNVNFTATNTTFNQGSAESVLSFAAAAAAADTLLATVVDCTFDDTECEHEMITGYLCGNVEIKNTVLLKKVVRNKAAMNLYACVLNDDNEAATLKLEKLHFRGEIEDEDDAAWIKVQGNHSGPIVTLKDNDYTNLNSTSQKGRVYRFQVEHYTTPIGFSITREAQTEEQIESNWDADRELATVVYVERDSKPYFFERIFPIGDGNLTERQVYTVTALCCYATKINHMVARSPENSNEYGHSIAECLRKGKSEFHSTVVTVTEDCPLGDVKVISNAVIRKFCN